MSTWIEQGGESCPEGIPIPILKLRLVQQNQEKNALTRLCVAWALCSEPSVRGKSRAS